MKLTELEPQFFKYDIKIEDYKVVDPRFEWDGERKKYLDASGQSWQDAGCPSVTKTGPRHYFINVDTLAEAQGIRFLCPKCKRDGGHDGFGVHSVIMPFADRGVDPAVAKHQWNVSGSGYADLTTTPSYLIVGGCGWHGYITSGEASII